MSSLSILAQTHKHGLGPGIFLCKEVKDLYSLCWICHFVWEYLICYGLPVSFVLFCLSVCIIWHLANPLRLLFLAVRQQVLLLQHKEACAVTLLMLLQHRSGGHGT